MSQVRNIATGRMILERNAVWSTIMNGHLHVNGYVQIATAVETISSLNRFHTFNFTYDFVTPDYKAGRCETYHFVARNGGSGIVYKNVVMPTGTNLAELYRKNLDGRDIYFSEYVDLDNLPDWLTEEVQVLEYNGGSQGALSYNQFKALPVLSRPSELTGNDSLREVRKERVMRIKFESNLLTHTTRQRYVTYTDANGTTHNQLLVSFERGSDSETAVIDYINNRHRSSGGSGLFGYHRSGQYREQFDAQMETGKWYFGIEAEKQDADARSYASYLGGRCGNWGAERDSSLRGGGVEFISPILPLHNGSLVRKTFQKHKWMLDAKLDNGGSENRSNCGGHITISKKGTNGAELMGHLHHFMPLFYSLYIGRLNTNYGGAIRKSEARFTRSAVSVKSFGVEIRIFSGVPSMEGAWWRVQLLQVIANMIDSGEVLSYKDVANAMVSDKHPLRKVLRKMYDSKRIRDKFALVLTFGHMYETDGNADIDISGTSDDVKHKGDRLITAFNEFRDVRTCVSRLWSVNGISVR